MNERQVDTENWRASSGLSILASVTCSVPKNSFLQRTVEIKERRVFGTLFSWQRPSKIAFPVRKSSSTEDAHTKLKRLYPSTQQGLRY